MQFIRDIYSAARLAGKPVLSLEFFPTKTEEGERALFDKTLPALMAIQPAYCSVTYGAGGGTRDKTLGIVDRIQKTHGLPAMMHLTCVNSTSAELGSVLDEAGARGIKNILALRGDPPGNSEFVPTEGGFEYSRELVAFIHQRGHFSIGTAGFPEGHIAQSAGKHIDWEFLAEKVEAGADFIITQLFFDNADYYEFHDYLVGKLGVTVPIIPGIMPILSAGQTKRFVALCGAKLPAQFVRRLDELDGDDEAVLAYGIEYATEQCASLLEYGVPGLHFYTLNKARSTVQIARNLGLAPLMSLRVYAYEKCDTCRKALKFLVAKKIAHEVVPIRAQPPSVAELKAMLGYVGGDLRKLFNTAGQDYRALDMKTRLPKLKVDEAFALLASNGNLVKRPFALTKKVGVVGFHEEEWVRFVVSV